VSIVLCFVATENKKFKSFDVVYIG
jgi:hypothetical protein